MVKPNHGIAILHLYDHLGNLETKDDIQLVYTRSEWMAADICIYIYIYIYTKGFTNKDKWNHACELVNVMDPKDLEEVILRRANIFQALRYDQKWDPVNRKPQSGSSATNRAWLKEQAQWFASANDGQWE